MADNNDFTKKILIDVEVKAEQVKKDLPALISEIEKLNQANASLKKSGEGSSKTFIDNAQQLRQLKSELRDANKYIDNVAKAVNAETGTLQQQRAVLSVITSDYVKLGDASGVSAAQLKKFTVNLKEQEFGIEQTYRNVGNYTDSLNKAEIALKKGTAGMNAYSAGIGEVRKGIGFLPQQLGAVTGQLGSVMQIGNTAYSALSASVSQFNVVLKDHEALQKDVIVTRGFLTKATQEAAVAQEELAAGTITAEAAGAANTAQIEAQTAATIAQTAATNRAVLATDLLKVALASTGIGLILIALAGLVTYFNNTNDGAKKFAVILAEVKAVGQELMKVIAPLGKAIFDTFTQSEGPLRLFGGLLRQASLPLATIVKLIGDIATGQFKQAFVDAGDAVKQFGTNVKDILLGTGQTVVSLSKNVVKASADIKISSEGLKAVAAEAAVITVERQKLTKEERIWSEEKLKQQGILDVLKLKIRDTGTTEAARIKAAKEAKAISNEIYQTDIKHATENSKLIEREQALNSKKDYQAITDAHNRVTQITNSHNQELQSIQNRESRVENMLNKRGEKEAKLREDAQKAQDEVELMIKDSQSRILQGIYEDYGDKVIAAQDYYNKEITKLKGYLTDKKITQQVYNGAEKQFTLEHQKAIGKIIDEFRKQDYDKFIEADNQLRALQIANIQDDTKRSLAALAQKGIEENEALDKQDAQSLKNIAALEIEKSKLSGAALEEVKNRIDSENLLLEVNAAKRKQLLKKNDDDEIKIRRDAANKIIADQDRLELAKTDKKGQGGAHFNALVASLEHQRDAELSNTKLTEIQRLAIIEEYENKIDALKADKRSKRIDLEVQAEQQAQSFAFDIISQSMQTSQQQAQSDLQNRKSAELENASLTNTQKKLIEKKYQKQDEDLKRKAFNDNKKLQAANILINGAVAITAALALPPPADLVKIGFIAATTAASLAKTLTAKPGFAEGGVYKSDGRGAMLPGYSKRDNINSSLRSGEAVVVSEAMRNPWARNLISDVNQYFGGRSFSTTGHRTAFADGGIFNVNDGGYANRLRSESIGNQDYIIQGIANKVGKIQPIVDVKDIVSEVAILVRTKDRVDL